MTLNFFTAQQGFQKPLIDTQSHASAKKEYVPSAKKEEFSTTRSEQNNLNQSKREDEFARLVRELKNADSSENKIVTPRANINENAALPRAGSTELTNTDTPTPANSIGLFAKAFHTKETAPTIGAPPAIQASDLETGELPINSANIAALNAEIQRLIEAQTSNDAATEQITATISPETKPEEVKSIFALLASFISDKTDKSDEADQGGDSPEMPLISILKNIEELAKSDEAAAITTGLSPQQLTQLQEHIQKYLNDELSTEDAETLEAIAAQFVSLTPPVKTKRPTENEAIIQANVQILPEQANAPVKKELIEQETSQTRNRYDNRFNARYEGEAEASADTDSNEGEKIDFKSTLKNLAPKDRGNAQNAGQRFLQATGLGQNGGALIFDPLAPQGSVSTTQVSPLQSALTNVITQSQNAGHPHPATQLVSATIQKAVKAGEDTNIKLKLDPPELGRVEVKMSIDKDNATRVVLTIEKPETYTLLKQDMEVLQRALNDAGLETNGDISFEMADKDDDFGNSKHSNNKGSSGSEGSPENLDENIIETAMSWRVDPNTGLMHYNALV